ncbi:hypothetical protein J6590_073380 [Homalodisca vitripennis]|nr:hypothetical protein J6590_073380 [Homalodisca vitripennis]
MYGMSNMWCGVPYVRDYRGRNAILYFPIGPSNATVNQATLRLFAVGPLGSASPCEVILRVYQVRDGPALLLNSTVIRLHLLSRWVELDVATAVSSWLAGQRNLGLEVECEGCSDKGVRVLNGTQADSSFSPVLNVLVTERESVPRSPRAMGGEVAHYDDTLGTDCRKGPNHGRCCRHSMEGGVNCGGWLGGLYLSYCIVITHLKGGVNCGGCLQSHHLYPFQVVFKDVPGFEFILQPYKFNAGFCKGRCPPRYHPASQHALLQSLVWQMYRAPRPCCAPHVLADIEVLHLDETDPSSLKVSTWKGMQVQRCACS